MIKKLGQSVLTLTIRFGRDREMSGFNSQALRERDGTGVGLPLAYADAAVRTLEQLLPAALRHQDVAAPLERKLAVGRVR